MSFNVDTKSIDEMIESFDLSDEDEESGPRDTMSFNVSQELKQRYLAINSKSGRKLGKLLKRVIETTIERVAAKV